MTGKIEIGPLEVAKLLYPLRGTIGEISEQLVDRVKTELKIGGEYHARFVVDYLEATACLEKEIIGKNSKGTDLVLYKLTPRGTAITEDKRYL